MSLKFQNPPLGNPQSPYSSVADTPPPAYTAQAADNMGGGGMTPQQQMGQPPSAAFTDQSQVGDAMPRHPYQ